MSKNSYKKLEEIVTEKVIALEQENSQLKYDLALAKAKLEVYDRLATITDSKVTLGFGPPIIKE